MRTEKEEERERERGRTIARDELFVVLLGSFAVIQIREEAEQRR